MHVVLGFFFCFLFFGFFKIKISSNHVICCGYIVIYRGNPKWGGGTANFFFQVLSLKVTFFFFLGGWVCLSSPVNPSCDVTFR